jgi:hypothetical protein
MNTLSLGHMNNKSQSNTNSTRLSIQSHYLFTRISTVGISRNTASIFRVLNTVIYRLYVQFRLYEYIKLGNLSHVYLNTIRLSRICFFLR